MPLPVLRSYRKLAPDAPGEVCLVVFFFDTGEGEASGRLSPEADLCSVR